MFKIIDSYLNGLARYQCFFLMFVGSGILGIIDYLLGQEISFSVFYTIPIMLTAWYAGKRAGVFLSVISSIVWLTADIASGSQYSTSMIPIWNTLVRLAFFLIILYLLLVLKEKLELEESLADTDPLTGLSNRRFFYEQLDREHSRLQRYPEPITIVYFDLDNFKYVNDSLGHDIGDELLIAVARTLSQNTRNADFVAQIGGDEFSAFFPLLDKESSLPVVEKLQKALLTKMNENGWPVTFSIGMVTFTEVMSTSRDMVKRVDNVMYKVKKSGKNNILHEIWPEKNEEETDVT